MTRLCRRVRAGMERRIQRDLHHASRDLCLVGGSVMECARFCFCRRSEASDTNWS